jgi:hypothetical protein
MVVSARGENRDRRSRTGVAKDAENEVDDGLGGGYRLEELYGICSW